MNVLDVFDNVQNQQNNSTVYELQSHLLITSHHTKLALHHDTNQKGFNVTYATTISFVRTNSRPIQDFLQTSGK